MSIQTSITKLGECSTCRGQGFIRIEMPELAIPRTESYSKYKVILAFLLGTLILSPALLGLYWEMFLK